MTNRPWWHDATGYALYLRSFADGTGDGVGDLPGVIDHLDHLEYLGIDLLWISPFYRSPMVDGGYDVTDHTEIDPTYGTMADFKALIRQAHARRIAVVIDLVANHTSAEHSWFQAARTSREDRFHDRYIWADPAPDGGPPNNWVSYFGGSAWTFEAAIGQYYLHLFLPEQPDLNWRNPAVRQMFDDIIEFWLDLGVDGFRIDVAQGLVKDRLLRSNPVLHVLRPAADRIEQWRAFEHRHDVLQPETIDIFRRWKAICHRYDAVLIGEVSVGDANAFAFAMDSGGLDIGMWLEVMHSEWDADALRSVLSGPIERKGDAGMVGWLGSSLDEPRAVTRFGGGEVGRRRALALATLLAFLPGTPFLYQGEELGLEQGEVCDDNRVDPVGIDAASGRDGCRTPMPWTNGPMHGFTTANETWLPFAADAGTMSVQSQRRNHRSQLARYRCLLAARRAQLVDADPTVEWLDFEEVGLIGFRRGVLNVIVNTTNEVVEIGIHGQIVFDSFGLLDRRVGLPSSPGVVRARIEGSQAIVFRGV